MFSERKSSLRGPLADVNLLRRLGRYLPDYGHSPGRDSYPLCAPMADMRSLSTEFKRARNMPPKKGGFITKNQMTHRSARYQNSLTKRCTANAE